MALDRNKLYSILLVACVAGYIWLYYGITTSSNETHSPGVCLIKHATSVPCPSCGTTRSVISLSEGNFNSAFMTNPFGFIVAAIMLIVPFWVLFDLATKRSSLFEYYQKMEAHLRKPKYAFPLIFLVLINWVWNIAKGL